MSNKKSHDLNRTVKMVEYLASYGMRTTNNKILNIMLDQKEA